MQCWGRYFEKVTSYILLVTFRKSNSLHITDYFQEKVPYSGLFSRGKIFANTRCGDISRVKFLRMVNKELINDHTLIYFQGENIRE